MRRALRETAFAAALVAAGCSGAGVGDEPSAPAGGELGPGSRLHELLGEATWLDQKDEKSEHCEGIPLGRQVFVTGVTIGAIDRFDETGGGSLGTFYVQDALVEPLPFSGIDLYGPTFSPPDLRLIDGDTVDLAGTLAEFPGPSTSKFPYCQTLPEIGGAVSFRFDGTGGAVRTIPVADLGTYKGARQWLGMLVRVEKVRLICSPYESSSGRYSIGFSAGQDDVPCDELPSVTNELFDLKGAGPPLAQGDELAAVTGIVTYFYGVHIAPRSAADIEP